MSYTRRSLLAVACAFATQSSVLRAGETLKRPKAASEIWARTELYFGTNRANGLPVTDTEFNGFVEQVISTHFPDGLTRLTGDGQFRSSSGELIRERSHVVILLYPPQMRGANQRIQDIRQRYKDLFGQESVLRVDSFSLVSF